MTIIIIGVNIAVFIYQYFVGTMGYDKYLMAYGLTPSKLFLGDGGHLNLHGPFPEYLKIISSMFMHGGFLHIIMNMWVLWIFGDNVEDSMGKIKYLIFYLICGIAATLSHAIFNRSSPMPLVGASGAIAGVMGAYFILFPTARVVTLFWFLFIVRIIKVPAFLFLGFWFLLQILFSPTGGPVAYMAHVGGFITGIVLVFLFTNRQKGFRIISIK
jgi:membrane associated rhomboid family serine protease